MKRLIATVTLLALCAVPSFAQTSPQPTTPTTPPAAQDRESMPPLTKPTTPPATQPMNKSTSVEIPLKLSGNDWRASKLIGQPVRNAANETIGDINELMIDSGGKVSAVIIGVGGFLGLGEKHVALPLDQLSFSRDANNNIVVNAKVTKETLQAAPEYKLPSK